MIESTAPTGDFTMCAAHPYATPIFDQGSDVPVICELHAGHEGWHRAECSDGSGIIEWR